MMRGHAKVVLIIEAPLCGLLRSDGNPMERGAFEKSSLRATASGTRYWYSGAGGSICLGAIFFLRGLLKKLQTRPASDPLEIVIFEGFVTFKTETTAHIDDATRLLDCFIGKGIFKALTISPQPQQSLVSIINMASGMPPALSSAAPTIVVPQLRVSTELFRWPVTSTRQVDVSNRIEFQHWLREQKVQTLYLNEMFLDIASHPKSNFAIDDLTEEDFRWLTEDTPSTEFRSIRAVGPHAETKPSR